VTALRGQRMAVTGLAALAYGTKVFLVLFLQKKNCCLPALFSPYSPAQFVTLSTD
jgi:hypothetical protein